MTRSLRLYTTPLSANGRKVMAVAKQLNLRPEIVETNVYKGEGQTPEFLAINPFGKIPTLVEGDFILWESNAIIQYLADKHGKYNLSSQDPTAKADITRWLLWEASHWQPAISKVLAATVGHALVPQYVPAPDSSPDWEDAEFVKLANYLDQHLETNSHLCQNQLTIADFAIASMMTYFHFGEFPFENFTNISNWYKTIEQLDAWKLTETPLWNTKHNT